MQRKRKEKKTIKMDHPSGDPQKEIINKQKTTLKKMYIKVVTSFYARFDFRKRSDLGLKL